ncbi:hypothetical protein FD755_016336 [Muntiacus reevesi]|uniref:UBC core domain-containing protein n=1 Tax=Muntiacus reevesi TaxID=9886 RepID=A0A5N3XGZ8_MUNRE|nr:hypothetical protein FD755_016336 [Muntiacus reevesi]
MYFLLKAPHNLIETQSLLAEPVPGIKAELDESNTHYFHVLIAGPQDSTFERGTFKLELFLPEEYPMVAPKVHFMTKIYHPNVDKLGRVILKIRTVLPSIRTLLNAPNPDDSLANDIRAWTIYAMNSIYIDSITKCVITSVLPRLPFLFAFNEYSLTNTVE